MSKTTYDRNSPCATCAPLRTALITASRLHEIDGLPEYMLSLLMAILVSNTAHRHLLGLVLQDIKVDLDVSDAQLGLLTSIVFALFYSVMGIPIARWADTGNRRTIITMTTALWSIMLIACGFAANFMQLLLARIGVAIGQAGLISWREFSRLTSLNMRPRPRRFPSRESCLFHFWR